MKTIIAFLLLIVMISCNDNKKQIRNSLLVEYPDIPKIKMAINLDSLKKAQEDKGVSGIQPPHLLKYNDSHKEWHIVFGSGSESYRESNKYTLKDGYKWRIFYSDDFEQFGEFSLINPFCKNEIGYEFFGKEKDVISEIDIVLNIYTFYKKQEALSKLSLHVKQISRKLNIELPKGLYQKINKGEMYYFENDLYYAMLIRHDKNKKNEIIYSSDEALRYKFDKDKTVRYESFKFIIKSK